MPQAVALLGCKPSRLQGHSGRLPRAEPKHGA